MTTHTCPVCGRERMVGHPSGFTWQHSVRCRLLAAEDSTAAADAENLQRLGRHQRPVTDAERTLLAACGVDLAPDALTTVTAVTRSVLHRGWPGVDIDAEPDTEQEPPDAA